MGGRAQLKCESSGQRSPPGPHHPPTQRPSADSSFVTPPALFGHAAQRDRARGEGAEQASKAPVGSSTPLFRPMADRGVEPRSS